MKIIRISNEPASNGVTHLTHKSYKTNPSFCGSVLPHRIYTGMHVTDSHQGQANEVQSRILDEFAGDKCAIRRQCFRDNRAQQRDRFQSVCLAGQVLKLAPCLIADPAQQ